MQKLLALINSLSSQERDALALACKTSIGYLRKAVSAGEKLNAVLCIALEKATAGYIKCEELRPDLAEHWEYIRDTNRYDDQPQKEAA